MRNVTSGMIDAVRGISLCSMLMLTALLLLRARSTWNFVAGDTP